MTPRRPDEVALITLVALSLTAALARPPDDRSASEILCGFWQILQSRRANFATLRSLLGSVLGDDG
jgi:hypothetical protein